MFDGVKVVLNPDELPTKWYNILADLPAPLPPPLHPLTKEPAGPPDLIPLFPVALLQQEMSPERYIPIPEELQEAYRRLGRPSPLYRAKRLEEYLDTPAKIYYKREDLSPTGSHKPNTAIAQAYFAMKEGVERITTETGAGQWGSALSLACALFDIKCRVYMVGVSYDQKPYRRILMQTYGSEVFRSPSNNTEVGRSVLKETPDHPGSLGLAISEAVEDALNDDKIKYSLGSVLNHVLLHQTIVGQEVKKQFEEIGEYPDMMLGCVGGGSNFAGFFYPFVPDKLKGKDIRFIAVEPKAVPTLTRAPYAYDYGDTGQLAPIVKMYTLGHKFVPPPLHAGGLRYHGDAPTLCLLQKEGILESVAYHQIETFEAGVIFAKTEGLVPAPETNHAIVAVIREAQKCKETGEEKIIAFNYSGHGHFDLKGYEEYLAGNLVDYEMPQKEIEKSLECLPKV
jgi:tryptophan synthase beta chain